MSDDRWQLIRSPLYATEVAAGDVIRITNGDTGDFEIVARGRNVCVQFYLGGAAMDDADATSKVAAAITKDIGRLGGSMDALTPGLIAFTIPVDAGFTEIERVFAAAAAREPDAEWQYTNVYDATTGEPLGWWE